MTNPNLPAFPYGAVYFRKSNPPQADWVRDYGVAAADGMNIFRHWVLWSAIEIEPGNFDWADYDRQLDLAAENGLKTIIAEFSMAAPEWAFRRYAHARYETIEGRPVESQMSGSCATGGFPGLCLDNDDYKDLVGNFLTTLVNRYKDHPGMGGYDVWNESNYRPDVCYCAGTAQKFRAWLQAKYGDLRTLGRAWQRHSFAEWEDITAPRHLGPYPHVLDWLQFRIDRAYELMHWKVELIRSLDSKNAVTAHGIAASLTRMANGGADDWRAAAEVESYGYTWGSSRHGDEPWKQFHAVDLVRAASRGKPFWHAETYAGPLWMQPQVVGKPRNEGRIAGVEDIRYWDMTSFMLGATGMLYLRWRPLLDGPLFGAFGGYGMDGSRTPRSEMVRQVGQWATAPAQADLWKSRPIQGEVGIVYVPETQQFIYAQQGKTDFYSQSMQGAYQGFFSNNIQADWVHLDDIDQYDFLYLPIPVMLTQATADKLRNWVAAGGVLVAEGCPAYWGDRAHVGTVQPNLGLADLFGCRESNVEFTPDILGDLKFNLSGIPTWGGIFLQAYTPTTGTPVGWYADGQVAAVDNSVGQGKTRLLGTMVGAGYAGHSQEGASPFFADLLDFAGKEQHIRSSDPQIKARLHTGDGGIYLWVANPTRQARPARLALGSAWRSFTDSATLWGAQATVAGQTVVLTAPARDVTVLKLR
ncbi:MAG: beta-galactosidase [Caldilineaceae bacterium]